MKMGLLVSYNIACKKKHPTFFENVDMIRINTPWYTKKELIDVLQNQTKPKFVDVNIKTRTKAKISDFDHQNLLKLLGENDVEWVGISNIEDANTYN